MPLLYHSHADAAKDRLTAWWHGADLGRPVMLLQCPRPEPWEDLPHVPEPPGWTGFYSTADFDYRIHLARTQWNKSIALGEMIPVTSPDLAPNCLALYLGCKGVESTGTVWCEPCIASPETARFAFDEKNFYWQFTLRLGREIKRRMAGKLQLQFPDLIEGLDTLAAMRDTETLLVDLLERPDWVHESLHQITQLYFRYYDVLYDLMRDERGGSIFWMWAPGRMAKFQCDFSAMIGPEMFGEFMVPVLREMTERVSYCMYHWDGPGAIPHHDHLLSLPNLKMIQWTPGAGVVQCLEPQWWPLYHKTIEAGKKVFLYAGSNLDDLRMMRKEFGRKLHQFALAMWLNSEAEAREALEIAAG